MNDFFKKHPVIADVCDTTLSLLSGSFALVAVAVEWVREHLHKES